MAGSSFEVPFYANPDNTHCFQAALRMVLKCFRPAEDYSWAQLDAITAKANDISTWPFAGLTWLCDHGFEVRNIELMDNRRFAREGLPYVVEFLGADVVAASRLAADLSSEQAAAARFVETVRCETRIPDLDDIEQLLADGYVVICNVNSRTLNDREGYSGHFVVVTSCDARELVLHDPGQPPTPQRHVRRPKFERAWGYPDEHAKNIVAIRLQHV